MAKNGLPKKYAAHGFKKGWSLYKRALNAAKRKRNAPKNKSVTVTRKKTTPKKTIKGRVRVANKKLKKASGTVRRKARGFANSKTGTVVIDGLVISSSLIVSTVGMNTIPKIKDLNPFLKGGVQFGFGLMTVLFVKNKLAKKAGMGIMSGSIVTTMLPYVRKLIPDVQLFGKGNGNFSPEQLRNMQDNLGVAVNVAGNAPTYSMDRKMGQPVNLAGGRRTYKDKY